MIQDTGYRIQDTGYRIQDTGYRILFVNKNAPKKDRTTYALHRMAYVLPGTTSLDLDYSSSTSSVM